MNAEMDGVSGKHTRILEHVAEFSATCRHLRIIPDNDRSGRIRVCSTQPRRNSAGVAKSVQQPEPRISRLNWSDKISQVTMAHRTNTLVRDRHYIYSGSSGRPPGAIPRYQHAAQLQKLPCALPNEFGWWIRVRARTILCVRSAIRSPQAPLRLSWHRQH